MKILVFAPHAYIWIHAFPEALVAEALAKAGHEIVYVACDRQFADYCVAMSAAGVPFGASADLRSAICDRCRAHAGLIRERFPFRATEIGQWLSPGDEDLIRGVVAKADRRDPGALQLGGLAIGRFALYQLLIRRKKMMLDFSEDEWSEYRVQLASAARAVLALQRLFEKERPDRVMLYNGLYSINLVCRHIADRAGVPTYFLHAGGNLAHRLQTLMIGRDHTFRFFPALLEQWPRFRDRPVSPPMARMVTDHFVEVLRGRSVFVYSSQKSSEPFLVRERFGIPLSARILVATLGSYDEEFAAETVGARVHERPAIFPMQSDWIGALCEFMARRLDLFLIVRVHPREFPNRREQVQSQHAALLMEALAHLPENVKVNWPDDRISLYDLAEETDVFLNSWSSVGKEKSLLGRPVVTYAPDILFYPPDLNYDATTRSAYFAQIELALAEGWSAEHIRRTYRWLAVEYGYGLVDIADGYTKREHENERPSIPLRAWNRLRRTLDPLHVQKRDLRRRPARLAAAPSIVSLIKAGGETILDTLGEEDAERTSPAEEDRTLRNEISRLMPHLYPGTAKPPPGTLHAKLIEYIQ
jgi:hypothetical protein